MKEGWTTRKFSDIFDLQMGKTPSRDNSSYWGGTNTWVSIADMNCGKYIYDTKEHITNSAVSESGIYRVSKDTVIMSFKLSIGKTAIATKDLYTNEAIMSFNTKEGFEILPDYIYYYLKGYKWQGMNKAVMGMTLNKKAISNNIFSYPNTLQQQHIVEELDLLSSIIEKKKTQLHELDNMAQSLFYEMFGDPIINDKGWKVIRLGDKCQVSSFKRVLIEDVVDKGIPFIRGTELMTLSNGDDVNFTLFITPEHYEVVKEISGVPIIGDLLIPSINAKGNIWIVNTEQPRYYKDGRVLWVHVDSESYTSETLKYIMSLLIKKTYSVVASGATFAELKLFVLRDLRTIIPPISIQQRFSEGIKDIERQKGLVKQSIKEVETLFNSRMDYYFN